MTTYSLHTLSDRDFERALRDDLRARDLNALTAYVAMGTKAYAKFLRSEVDGPHMILEDVGFIRLVLDGSLGEWDGAIVEREDA
jgi:hypothetical protein